MPDLQQSQPGSRIPVEEARDDGMAHERQRETERSMKVVAGGFSLDALAGAAALVLAILGIAGVASPTYFAAISAIALGAALLIKSSSVAAQFRRVTQEIGGGRNAQMEIGAGVSAEMLAGLAAITLGVLGLILTDITWTLCAAAVITLGGAMLLSGGETYRVSQLSPPGAREPETTRSAVESSAGGETLVGIAAVTLGILAFTLNGPVTTTLVLVGFLALGAAELLAGMSVTSHLARQLRS